MGLVEIPGSSSNGDKRRKKELTYQIYIYIYIYIYILPKHLDMNCLLLTLFFITPQLDYTRSYFEFVVENSSFCIQSLYLTAWDLVPKRQIIRLIEIF